MLLVRLTLTLLLGQPLPVAERHSVGLALGQAELLRDRLRVPLVQRDTVGEAE